MPVFDLECDGFNPTKIHVLSYWENGEAYSLTDYDAMRKWVARQRVLVGHNIISFDVPVLERLLGIRIKAKLIDTLYLSWYLYPLRTRHGLEYWGEDFGIPKPKVTDWDDQPIEVYINRCEEDVKINQELWEREQKYLCRIYNSNDAENLPITSYLMFKAACAAEQERRRWHLDIAWCEDAIQRLEALQQPLIETLAAAMPPVVKMKKVAKPNAPFKKDGTVSVAGAKWFALLKRNNLPEAYAGLVEVVDKEEPPNPDSPAQVKDWLYSLGWVPETFKYVRNEDGEERQIPQIKVPNTPDLCPSILRLAEDNESVKALENLSVLKHRLGTLRGFLNNQQGGFLKARVQGLTNTLRFQHTEIVNLPGVGKPWGLEIRGALTARDGYELIGTDMNSLEDNTKRHYMFKHDPEYVKEMSRPGFDPHLDIAVASGALSKADLDYYEKNKKNDKDPKIKIITSLRKDYKVVNYSAVYGVGAATLSRSLKDTPKKAKKLLKDYWARNWAVKKVAEECVVKDVDGQKWLYNPVSKFWYTLRADKDRFSTLNQGTGVFCFDSWLRECKKLGLPLTAQFHDESVVEVKKGEGQRVMELQQEAIKRVNDRLKLNVTLGVSPQIGYRYSDIH